MATYTLDDVIYNCKKNFTPQDTLIVKNTDGTISVYTQTNIVPKPFILSETCCKFLNTFDPTNPSVPTSPQGYFFDLQEQKCRWAPRPTTTCETPNTPIKIVLNPKGNDGSIFDINGDENCALKVDFDFLLKLNCETLANAILNASKVSNTTQSQEIVDLKNSIEEQETKVEDITKQINSVAQEFVNLNYSIVCEDFPFSNGSKPIESTTNETTIPLTEAQKSPFSKTGFGSVAPMSFAMPTRSVIFCLMEPDGLKIWQKILGPDSYKRFIDGDITSYTTKQVVELYNENEILIKENKAPYIVECETPFGYKTQIKKKLDDLILTQNKNNTILTESKQILNDLTTVEGETNCGDLIDYFENLSVKMMIDVVEDDNTLTPLTQQQIFPVGNSSTIGAGNLYTYLVGHPLDSGFYVCGQPNQTETWAAGCTSIYYTELTNTIQPENTELNHNVSSCINVKDALLEALFLESGYQNTEIDLFHDALSPNILASNWLHFSQIFDSQDFISGATNQKLKLSLVVNNNCGEFCVLIDQITLQRECQDIRETSVFISESPGFNLTKVIDNKKSWLNNTDYDYRDFEISNVSGVNPIRQTEYDVNDDRLVINTKEIDLNMNIASAVEYDVWCYMSENPCLLTGTTCASSSGVTPTDIYGNKITLPTAQTYTYNASELIDLSLSYYSDCLKYTEAVGIVGIDPTIGIFCLPESECMECGEALKIKFDNNPQSLDPQYDEFWVVCDINGLSAYVIEDPTDAQNTIYNITNSLNGSAISELTNLVNVINIKNLENLQIQNPPQYNIFWDSMGNCASCCIYCGDENIDFSSLLTDDITQVKTIENFEYLIGNFIDAKSRKTLSGYPTLRAIYDRYMNSTKYCDAPSLAFDYYKMDEFSNLITTYWDDLIEQVIPSTTLWGSIKVYTNTMFDQQKFKYKSYTSLFCNSPLNFVAPPSPINGSRGQCQNVNVVVTNIGSLPEGAIARTSPPIPYNSLCLTQMNWGSEFVGNVNIVDVVNGVSINDDGFCDLCRKVVWYDMVTRPEYIMFSKVCDLIVDPETIWTIDSFIVNGAELVNTPLTSTTITSDNVIFIPANNNIISGCTFDNPTGFTYTNFVDFLNDTFLSLNLYNYTAVVSLKEKNGVGVDCSKNGFYIKFPENDTFSLVMTEIGQGYIITYTNDGLSTNLPDRYYCSSENVDYDCVKDIINE